MNTLNLKEVDAIWKISTYQLRLCQKEESYKIPEFRQKLSKHSHLKSILKIKCK